MYSPFFSPMKLTDIVYPEMESKMKNLNFS